MTNIDTDTLHDIASDDRLAVTIAETARIMSRGEKPGMRIPAKAGGKATVSGRSSIYELIERGELDALKDGARTLITMESIRRRMASLPRVQPKPPHRRQRG